MEKDEEKLISIKFYNWDNFTEYENELWTNEERKTLEVVFQVLNENLNDNTIKSFCFGIFAMLISAVTTAIIMNEVFIPIITGWISFALSYCLFGLIYGCYSNFKNEDLKIAKKTFKILSKTIKERSKDLKKRISISNTLEENKEKSQQVKVMKEYLERNEYLEKK